jgi:hypothetical protein
MAMTRRQPTPEESEADRLTIWLIRNPAAAAALERWLNPDNGTRTTTLPQPEAVAQAEAEL